MKYDIKIDSFGTKRYFLNRVLHREEGPAIEYIDGEKHWYKNGELHRENGPAIERANGTKKWYKMESIIERMVQLVNIAVEINHGIMMAHTMVQIIILLINLGKNLLKL